MNQRTWRLGSAIACASLLALASTPAMAGQIAMGVVFEDLNENGIYDTGEPLLEGIRVSNGTDIVLTDADGRYELLVDDETIIFVIKPKDWRTAVNEDMLPQFYYIHKPNGSPPSRFAGSAPTGPLPESVDFPLYRAEEPDTFKTIVFADPQPRNMTEVEYVFHDVIEELIGSDAAFGVTLGDIAFDNLDTLEPQNRGIALIGIPWYNVIGNHDLNFESRDHRYSNETFHRIYGPSHYSFDYGNVHFLAIDNVMWQFPEGEDRGSYSAGLHDEQIQFIYNDLALIPEDQMVVLMMHIPITSMRDARTLYEMIENRPLCISISGHTHTQEHRFLNAEEHGWLGPEPHHHIINVTVSGSWWSGATDEYGIPHTLMRDGAPNGYAIMTFDGDSYTWEFKAARRPASHQMTIWAPEAVTSSDGPSTEIVANVFGGSEHSTVEMRIAEGEWITMERTIRHDPYFLRLKAIEESDRPPTGRRLPNPVNSTHLWVANLPIGLPTGTHLIEVRTRDMFGKEHHDGRIIRIE